VFKVPYNVENFTHSESFEKIQGENFNEIFTPREFHEIYHHYPRCTECTVTLKWLCSAFVYIISLSWVYWTRLYLCWISLVFAQCHVTAPSTLYAPSPSWSVPTVLYIAYVANSFFYAIWYTVLQDSGCPSVKRLRIQHFTS